jgi:hypothetical protein
VLNLASSLSSSVRTSQLDRGLPRKQGAGMKLVFKVFDLHTNCPMGGNRVLLSAKFRNLWRALFNNLYPVGYVAIGTILSGLLIMTGSITLYLNTRRKMEWEKEELIRSRTCPKCGQRVPIENPGCPHCGLDIIRFVQCEYCHAFYDRALPKCPLCGTKRRQ